MPKKNLEVSLISIPDNLLDVIYTACRTCYSPDGAIEIYNNITDDKEKKLSLIRKVISSGHYSTIEHIQLTFAINNISRAATHQLVRHRHASFSQKSQRYVKEKGDFDFIVPPAIEANSELYKKFTEQMEKTAQLYAELVSKGITNHRWATILLSVLFPIVAITGIWLIACVKGAHTPIGLLHYKLGILLLASSLIHTLHRK